MTGINFFLPGAGPGLWETTIAELSSSRLVNRIYLMGPETAQPLPPDVSFLKTDGKLGTGTIRTIADHAAGVEFVVILTGQAPVSFGMLALERFIQVALDMDATMVYADHFDKVGGELIPHPVIDYQAGSLRDDFDFGPVFLVKSRNLIAAAGELHDELRFAALYQLRLKLSLQRLPVRIQEFLYTVLPDDTRSSGEKIFDYVDPRNRAV